MNNLSFLIKLKVKKFLRKCGVYLRKSDPSTDPILQLIRFLELFKVNTVIDVGANIGQFAIEIREMGYADKIISIEPIDKIHSILLKNSYTDKNWTVYERCCVGDYNGLTQINISCNSVSSSILDMTKAHSIVEPNSVYVSNQNVKIKTLKSVIEDLNLNSSLNIFIKLDIQGAEFKAITGMEEYLNKVVGMIIEISTEHLYIGQTDFNTFIESMKSFGFVIWSIQPGFSDRHSGRMLQADVIFVRSNLM